MSTTPVVEDKLYLSTGIENVVDPRRWWFEHWTYPRLYRMALDYLSIPATSVDVEWLFSHGRLLLSHTRNRLSNGSTRALLCLGSWSLMGFVKDEDLAHGDDLDEISGFIELQEFCARCSND
ncbi:hypothetical protein C0992_008636 [Termitomyces sp. T32_za158]|nr:hypothetical protein C0992_008636 [Termitomyces sp. T32_za158]